MFSVKSAVDFMTEFILDVQIIMRPESALKIDLK